MDEKKIVNRLSAVGIGGNIALSAFKLFAGVVGNSGAMISDAVHSFSDVLATFIAWLGVRMSQREADDTHPYGHERMECLAAIMLSGILAAAGVGIGYSGVEKIVLGTYAALEVPGVIALVAAVVSIAVKEAMFWYTRRGACLLNSAAFMADAWHHRSDALSSVGALLGIGGAMLGFPICDPLASVVICIFILKAAYDILRDAIDKLLDTPCDEEFAADMRRVAEESEGVARVVMFRTRQFGSKAYVDVSIAVDGDLTVREGHAIAAAVHDEIERRFPNVKHVMVHVDPADE